MKKERNAHKRSTYARVSPDQAAIDEFYKQHGAKEAENTGKVFSFNNRGKRSVGHAKKIHVRADQGTNAQAQESHIAQWRRRASPKTANV